MAAGLRTENGGRVTEITLPPGLRFHDGVSMRARDRVASLRCWSSRHPIGRRLMAATDELSAPDDRKLRFRLRRPFPSLAYALGKLSTPLPFMMPERLAAMPPTVQIAEAIGSGPFRYVYGEWVQGSRLVYDRFNRYIPRDEPPSGTARGKRETMPPEPAIRAKTCHD